MDVNNTQANIAETLGINPKTGLPMKQKNCPVTLPNDIKKQLRIVDEQDAVNRYTWYNLPSGLTSQLMERMIYYRGQVAFFFMPSNGQFYCLPYALSGNIDVYGRYQGITPLPFNGTASTEKGGDKPWITGLVRKPIYDIPFEITDNEFLEGCVLIKDYTEQLSETIIPRQILQDPLLGAMSEVLPMARTSLIANSGVRGVRVQTEDDANNVIQASKSIENAAKSGLPFVPIVGSTDFQSLTDGTALKSEEYLLFLQSLDNYRLSLYGLGEGGLFQKKSHMLEAEQNMNAGKVKLTFQDGLTIRQHACDIINSIWGLGIWVEPSECVIAMDTDGDGVVYDNQDQSGMRQGAQPVNNQPTEEE